MENLQISRLTRVFLIALAILAFQACSSDDDSADNEPDASDGDTESESELPTEGFTCVECHIDKELLLADLEADPLPEPEEPPDSEGEG